MYESGVIYKRHPHRIGRARVTLNVDISERYLSSSRHPQAVPFLVRDVIYTSHAYAMMPSVHLSVMFVHCGHRVRVQWIPDIFACLDRWMSLLLTDNASPGSSDGMMPGFLVEEGGVWKNW